MLDLVRSLNDRDDIDGILIQLPLPKQVDTKALLDAVLPAKDVDGFHPVNAGKLQAGRPALAPCTPAGVIEILKRSNLPISGQHAVVVGRSDIVGKPVAMLLLHENATVTICHSKTRDLGAVTREADILVAAIGRPGFITPEMVKPGATIIDVGINRITTLEEFDRFFAGDAKREATFAKRGSTIVGDVHPKAFELAGAYTPVPGGVGPLTIAMLMSNTVRAAKNAARPLAHAACWTHRRSRQRQKHRRRDAARTGRRSHRVRRTRPRADGARPGGLQRDRSRLRRRSCDARWPSESRAPC